VFCRGCANGERRIDTQVFHIRDKTGASLTPRVSIKESQLGYVLAGRSIRYLRPLSIKDVVSTEHFKEGKVRFVLVANSAIIAIFLDQDDVKEFRQALHLMQSVHNNKFGQILPKPVLEEQKFGLARIVVHDHTFGPGEFVRRGGPDAAFRSVISPPYRSVVHYLHIPPVVRGRMDS
jgi:hypothetical protein